jgi:hypothetical protein
LYGINQNRFFDFGNIKSLRVELKIVKKKNQSIIGGIFMKKTLLTAALILVSSQAMASQVRFDSLQGARTTKQDFVEMFQQPSVMWSGDISDQVLFEQGGAGLIVSGEGNRYGFHIGQQPSILSTDIWSLGTGSLQDATYGMVHTPINVFYGHDLGFAKLGVVANLATSKVDQDFEKQFMGLGLGLDGGVWRVDLSAGLASKVKNLATEAELVGKSHMILQAEYDITESWRAYILSTQSQSERTEGASVEEFKFARNTLGVEKRFSTGFFYGLRYDSTSRTEADQKEVTTQLPLYLGGEVEVADWLVLRGAWSQPLMETSKIGSGDSRAKTLGSDATVTGGAGVRIGKSLVDVTTGVASQGFFSKVAYTYNF